MISDIVCRIATPADLPALRDIMYGAIEALQRDFLTGKEIAASHAVMGLDTQLIADGTYFLAIIGDVLVGCGGWSRRATLYGGDHSADLREPRMLDAGHEPARIRAMYTHPDYPRRGIGRAILQASEAAAQADGFRSAELMATMAGEPLYRACGYGEIERTGAQVGVITVPLVRMGKALP